MNDKILSIDYLKSALSINTFVGCSLGCKYCIVGRITEKVPKRISSPEEAVRNLLKNKFFIPNLTPIMINNKTDPFLTSVKSDTLRILELLQVENLKNPRIIISKLPLHPKDLEFLEELNETVFFIFSYSNLFLPLEKVQSSFVKISLETLKKRKKVKALHYWRPLIRGLNDSEESLVEVLENVRHSCDGSIISGIRIVGSIKNELENCGADLKDWGGDINHKHFPLDIQKRILTIRDKLASSYPLYRHTSCGINSCLNRSDWGFNFLRGFPHCLPGCKNKNNCILTKPKKADVEKFLKSIGLPLDYSLNEDHIYLNQEIAQDEKVFLSHSLNFPIKAEKINKSFSEKLILGEGDE